MQEDLWIPLVDEPVGAIVGRVETEQPEIRALVDSPEKLLAFRTFAYIHVGLVLGEQLVDSDESGDDWVDRIAERPEVWERIVAEVRRVATQVAEEVPDQSAADEEARERFREFAKRALASD